MTDEEFKNLKVGDKVQIVSKIPNTPILRWNPKMGEWLGKIMTIKSIGYGNVNMKEDEGARCYFDCGWSWYPEMIEKKIEESHTVVEHLIEGNKTIVKLSNGKVGIAKCSPDDEFDEYTGLWIATARAYGIEPFPKSVEEKLDEVREVARKAKVGEYIKIVRPILPLFQYNKCDCGTETKVRADHILQGKNKSCGCIAKEIIIKINQSDKQKNIVRKMMVGNKRRAKNEINTNIY